MNIFDILLYFSKKTVTVLQEKTSSQELKEKYRKRETDFTRERKLTYKIMLLLLLQKWVKSLQLRLNELVLTLEERIQTLTAQAFSKAREKLTPEVFLELNKEVLINRYYDIKENLAWYNTFWNLRILAIDGSKIRLPEEEKIQEVYWTTKVVNRNKEESFYTNWLLSTLHDPLNDLALDYILERWNYSERALAIKHVQNLKNLQNIEEKDLIILDRWYFSIFLFSVFSAYWKESLFRLRKKAIKEADELFEKDCKIDEKLITVQTIDQKKEYQEKYWIEIDKELPQKVQIRVTRVELDDWEIEVLATSLINTEVYNIQEFKNLYYERWWVEIFYDVIKNRLWLENFSWKTVHSVLQDLYSTIFLSNFETIMTRASNYRLEQKVKKKKNKNGQKVNKQISFNTLKNTVIDLFLQDIPVDEVMRKIMVLFEQNPTQIRPWRKFKRGTTSYKSLNYHKRKKKHCF